MNQMAQPPAPPSGGGWRQPEVPQAQLTMDPRNMQFDPYASGAYIGESRQPAFYGDSAHSAERSRPSRWSGTGNVGGDRKG